MDQYARGSFHGKVWVKSLEAFPAPCIPFLPPWHPLTCLAVPSRSTRI